MTLGNGFAVAHQWVQWYEYTGVYGGTTWIWIVNILAFLIYTGLREAQTKRQRMVLITAFVVATAAPLGYSLSVYHNYVEEVNPSNVVVAQPNIDPYEKDGTIPPALQLDILIHLSRQVAQPNTEFFIWPETAIPAPIYIDEEQIGQNNFIKQAQFFLRKYPNGNLITGAETFRLYNNRATPTAVPSPWGGDQYADFYSTALNIENGDRIQTYHKSRLVPGAESLPFGNEKDAKVLYSQSGIGVDPVICYESIWGGYIARSVKKGAQFIAIITNDGWWENTSGKDQHLDYAKLRAIETRRWVCQSANTGISGFINQRGDVVKQTEWWVKTAIKQDINLNSELTFYVKHGDYIPQTGSVLAGVGILFLVGMRLRKKQTLTAQEV
jgi:apolipoprotein N-acyltransferase